MKRRIRGVVIKDSSHSVVSGTLVLLGDEEDVDVGQDTSGSDGGSGQESVQLLVVSDGELDVSGHDSALLVVLSGVASELEDLGGEVLEDGSEVHGGTGTDSLGVSARLEESSDSSNGELESSLSGSGNGS